MYGYPKKNTLIDQGIKIKKFKRKAWDSVYQINLLFLKNLIQVKSNSFYKENYNKILRIVKWIKRKGYSKIIRIYLILLGIKGIQV